MHIFKYLANLPYNDERPLWLNCDLNPAGRWLMCVQDEGLKIKIEISHNSFIAWLYSKNIDHDINCTSYSLEI